jgi:hypothetical protein
VDYGVRGRLNLDCIFNQNVYYICLLWLRCYQSPKKEDCKENRPRSVCLNPCVEASNGLHFLFGRRHMAYLSVSQSHMIGAATVKHPT